MEDTKKVEDMVSTCKELCVFIFANAVSIVALFGVLEILEPLSVTFICWVTSFRYNPTKFQNLFWLFYCWRIKYYPLENSFVEETKTQQLQTSQQKPT